MSTDRFFSELPCFREFRAVTSSQSFTDFPSDWSLVLTDIRGSTRAIEEGRYKDVNVLGAVSIVAVLNRLKGLDIPYLFGGDGATLAVPNHAAESALRALRMVRSLAQGEFNLDLRVAVIPIQDLYREGYSVQLGRFELSNFSRLAMFRGSGLIEAERRLKAPTLQQRWDSESTPLPPEPQLTEGLECRWNPLAPRQGLITSLIVQANGTEAQNQTAYEHVIAEIENVLSETGSNPVSLGTIPMTWPPKQLWSEVKVRAGGLGFVKKLKHASGALLVSLLALILVKLNRSFGPFHPRKYLAEIIAQSDYRKFDQTLKMVIDCSPKQLEQLTHFLNELSQRLPLAFGIHTSKSAMMTCMVFSLEDHVHFIDGSNGGYAMAAKMMKTKDLSRGT